MQANKSISTLSEIDTEGIESIAKFQGYIKFKCPNRKIYYLYKGTKLTIESAYDAIKEKQCCKLEDFTYMTSLDEMERIVTQLYQRQGIEIILMTADTGAPSYRSYLAEKGKLKDILSNHEVKVLAMFYAVVEVLKTGSKTCTN